MTGAVKIFPASDNDSTTTSLAKATERNAAAASDLSEKKTASHTASHSAATDTASQPASNAANSNEQERDAGMGEAEHLAATVPPSETSRAGEM